MAKEGASYLAEILATRDNLPPEDRSRLEKALGILSDETQKTSIEEGAELIREKFGAHLGDDVVVWDLLRDPIEKRRYENRSGKIKTKKTDKRTDAYGDYQEFRDFVDTLPDNVSRMLTRSLHIFAMSTRPDWGRRHDTIRGIRSRKLESLLYMEGMGSASAQFLKTVFEPAKPQE